MAILDQLKITNASPRKNVSPISRFRRRLAEPIEQRGRHLGVAEDRRPFSEGEVGRDDDRCALVKAADQVEQQLAARLGEGEIAEFVENDEVEPRQIISEAALAPGAGRRNARRANS